MRGRWRLSDRVTIRRRSGAYEVDGQRLDRVTHLLGALPNPGLNRWRDRVGKDEAKRISGEAARRGTRVHELIERALSGEQLTGVTTEHAIAQRALEWLDGEGWEPLAVEMVVWGRAAAGTVDLWASRNGKETALIDWKVSSGHYMSHALQMACYAYMPRALLDATGDPNTIRGATGTAAQFGVERAGRLIVVRLDVSGAEPREVDVGKMNEMRAAIRAATLLRRWEDTGRRVYPWITEA